MGNISTPFTLPNGMAVILRPYELANYEALNRWIKKKYMENVREACLGLDDQSKLELRLAALSKAASLSIQTAEGRELLFSDLQGFSMMGYQLISDPKISFDEFFGLLYPHGVLTEAAVECIINMIDAAYSGDNDYQTMKEEIAKSGILEDSDEKAAEPDEPEKQNSESA